MDVERWYSEGRTRKDENGNNDNAIYEHFDIVDASKKYPNYTPSFKDAYYTINFVDSYWRSWQYLETETDEEFDNWCKEAYDLASTNLTAVRAKIILGSQPVLTDYNHKRISDILERKICIYENCLLIRDMVAKRIEFDKPIKAGIIEDILKDIYIELEIPYNAKVKVLNDLFEVKSKKIRIDGLVTKCYIFSKQSEDSKSWQDSMLFEMYDCCKINIKIPEGYVIKTINEYQKEQHLKTRKIVETIEELNFDCHTYKIVIESSDGTFVDTFYLTVNEKHGLAQRGFLEITNERAKSKNTDYSNCKHNWYKLSRY